MRGHLVWVHFREEMREATPAARGAVGAGLQPAPGKPVVLQPCHELVKPAGRVAGAGIPRWECPHLGPGRYLFGSCSVPLCPGRHVLAKALLALLAEALSMPCAPCCLGGWAWMGVRGGG